MIHEAGALEDKIQRCIYCDRVLADYRNSPVEYTGWPVGTWVNIDEDKLESSGSTKQSPNCYLKQ